MKTKLSIFFLLIFLVVNAQEKVKDFPIYLKKNQTVFQIIDSETQQISLFLNDKENVNVLKMDKNFQILDSITVNRPEKEFGSIVGYTSGENKHQIFWKNNASNKLCRQEINFATKSQNTTFYDLDSKNERKIIELSENNIFYYITVPKKSNILRLHLFDNEGNKSEKEIDLNTIKFYNSLYKKVDFYTLLDENLLPFENGFVLQKISPESPVSLTFASKKRKYYFHNNTLQITIDTNFDFTQLLSISFTDFVCNEKKIKKPYINSNNQLYTESNSFIINNSIFQIKSSSENLALVLKDFDENVLNEYLVTKEQDISFKNGAILQMGTEMGSGTRILDKTAQFLRKVSNSNIGISCYEIDNNYTLTIGSVSEIRNNSGVMYGAMFGVAGVMLSYMITNPVYDNFNSYANRKVVSIQSVMDKTGKHIEGPVRDFAFDKINTFLEGNSDFLSQTIFKIDANYYLGYYNKSEKKYIIRQFKD